MSPQATGGFFVRRSVQDAVRITRGVTSPKVRRQPLSLADKVRTRIELHGGRATSSQVLPYVGATASEVKALPEIVFTVERSGRTGRPATVFTLRGNTSQHEESAPAQRTVTESNGTKVVRLDAYRPTLTAPEPAPEPKRPEPVSDSNPFRALL